MLRPFQRSILASLGLGAIFATVLGTLTGCTEPLMSDRLPSELGGLPAGVPARPVTPYQYPAVHDMPPPRATTPMSDEEQVRLEKELQAIRDRQERREAAPQAGTTRPAKKPAAAAKKTAAPAKKKQPTAAIIVPPAGVKINP